MRSEKSGRYSKIDNRTKQRPVGGHFSHRPGRVRSPPLTRQRLQNLLQPSPPRRGAYIPGDEEEDSLLEANGFKPVEVIVHEEVYLKLFENKRKWSMSSP